MRKLGNFLRSIMRALRTTVKIPVLVAGETVDWVWATLFGGPAQPNEIEHVAEIPDAAASLAKMAIEDEKRDRERTEKQAAIARSQLPILVKRACGRIDMGGEISELDFNENPDAQWIVPWIQCLDESERRTIRHMPDDSLLAHLSGYRERDCLPSYQNCDFEAAKERLLEMKEAERTKGWTAIERFRDFIDQAVDRGDVHQVDHRALWIEAQRLAGVEEEDIDFGPYGPD